MLRWILMGHKEEYFAIFAGGGVRGTAYIGALKALEELDITLTGYASSSVGAIVASLIAVGYNPEELKDLLLSASAESVSFVLPDILYSRQDRKDRPHVPISARALANSISPGLKRIITMELHASQIQGFYPDKLPLDNLYSFPDAVKHFREHHLEDLKKLVLVSPDAGGAERTRSFLQRLIRAQRENNEYNEYSFALISKIRPSAGEIEEMRLVGDVKDKNCLIVDDIIDSGTTLCKAAELLKESGAKKIFAYATHGIFSKGTEELLKNFDAIMTSNTHSIENHRVEVIDVSGVFAEAIYRDIKGHSISKLFE